MAGFSKWGLRVYNGLWKVVRPLLARNSRIQDGLDQRDLSGGLPARADVWMQAASGGEAYLAWEVLRAMQGPKDDILRVLVTTNTSQGLGVLERAIEEINENGKNVFVQIRYFPFDAPSIMRSAFEKVRPKVAVILETEIWPAFLTMCKEFDTRILFANARMNPRSLAGYLTLPGLFRSLAPDKVLAISEKDALRFDTLFGRGTAEVMNNIKFDRMSGAGGMARKDNPLADIIPQRSDFVVFGSVREEEEEQVQTVLSDLRKESPQAVIGLFPRHVARVEHWRSALDFIGAPWTLRSNMSGPANPGTVIIWDTFGELVPAYALAKAAFVGGSLAPLGGQNFLEPLTCGVTPVIGPSWYNFAWVGEAIMESGLVIRGEDEHEVSQALIDLVSQPADRMKKVAAAKSYIKDRLGGAKTVSACIDDLLNNG